MPDAPDKFDPLGLLATLDRHRVAYIVIGAFARVVQGADEMTRGVDIVPAMRPENLRRLTTALDELNARRPDGQALDGEALSREEVLGLMTDRGELKVVPQPEGTRGFEDLRRAASREYLGRGVRTSIASTGDLARMLSALGREEDIHKLIDIRRVMELERGLSLGL